MRLLLKLVSSSNPFLPFTLFLLAIGVSAGLILTQNPTELRQQAAYFDCVPPAVEILTGADFGMCRCPGGPIINPTESCPNVVSTAAPTATTSCILDGQIIGQGGAVCCSGQTYQDGNNVKCGLRPNSTCTGSCVSSTKVSCSEIRRYTAVGTCIEKVGENMLCCGTTVAYSPTPPPTQTPFPTPICNSGEYKCVGNVEYYCYAPNAQTSTSCGNYGCNGNRCATPSPTATASPIPDTCSGMCVSAPSCGRLGKASAIGSCQNPSQVCCRSTGGQDCIPNTCVQRPSVFSSYAEEFDVYYPGGWGAWCTSDGTFGFGPSICGTGEDCGDTPDTICIQPGLRCIGGRQVFDETCVYQTPTPKIITSINCRINSDCGPGYLCLRDTGDNSFSCQPEVKSRDCWTYNFSTKQCESFKSFSGVSCPNGTSPNSDICIHPTPYPGLAQINCIPNQEVGKENFCIGNTKVFCDSSNRTITEACPGGCDGWGNCKTPTDGVCTSEEQWCDGNFLATCKLNYPGNGAAMFFSPFRETCEYGCNLESDQCNVNPETLSYIQTLEQNIEQVYGISIGIDYFYWNGEDTIDDQSMYENLLFIQETLSGLPDTFSNQVTVINILPIDESKMTELIFTTEKITQGATNGLGVMMFGECTTETIESGDCRHTVLHEIGHNTEDLKVKSSFCSSISTTSECLAIEGYKIAAETDSNPTDTLNESIHFNSDGSVIESISNTSVYNTDSPRVMGEFYADNQATYFENPQFLKETHPNIYTFFQDMYQKYPN